MHKDFNHSYWEIKHYFKVYDLIVVGSGIVGLSSALSFKEKNPKASILILEKGILPDGASTKNAGFACFGSPGELISDLQNMPAETVWETVLMRWQGLQALRARLGDKKLRYKSYGNFELFRSKMAFEKILMYLPSLNQAIRNELGLKNCFRQIPASSFPFRGVKGIIQNRFEGQLDTAEMMNGLISLAMKKDIVILNNISVSSVSDTGSCAALISSAGEFRARQVIIAVNGFASELLKIHDVQPARAQVLITSKIPGLSIKGAFHFDEGFYYFRNINKRILFGGGRNLDLKTETTTAKDLNPRIHAKLEYYLKNVILPGVSYRIEHRWTGTMGVGTEKKPIIKRLNGRVVTAVRLGGMGIAIGSVVGRKAADLCS